jgi:hypothetical protein
VPQGPKESLRLENPNDPRPGGQVDLWREGGLRVPDDGDINEA